jgi:hypothetical protein
VTYQVLVDGELVAELESDDDTYGQAWMAEHSEKAQARGEVTTNTIP